ncbi:MAG: efflux RND transporter permease subunit [Desulfobacteraceae bacterium]|nr:efflux RND transporter permease subunit [Desulfobacteraceae bacterium]
MGRVVGYSLKQAVLINVVFVFLTVAGVFALFSTPVEVMPSADMGEVAINALYYGATAEDVENLVTRKIEEAVDGLESVEYILSDSYRNYAVIMVKFVDDTNYRDLYDELRFRVVSIRDELPEDAEDPAFIFIDTHFWLSVIRVNILGDIPRFSKKLLADELKAEIIAIHGVKEVEIVGEDDKEFHVSLDPGMLREYGITFNQAAEAIRSANIRMPTGRFRMGDRAHMLDAGSRFHKREQVLDVVVRRDGDGNFIRVRDLAVYAGLGRRDPEIINSINGGEALRLFVRKEDTGNSVTIAKKVKEISDRFAAAHGKDGIRIVYTHDSTVEISDAVSTLGQNMILGMILITLVLWLTLGFRNAMITAVGIPFSFLCALIIIKVTGLTINTIALFSFVLVCGIIVDDAVIIMENVFRHQQMGKQIRDAIVDGVSEVMLPVICTAVTTVLAFVPMLIMTGVTGDYFSVIPKTVCFALIASLGEALFILPLHLLEWGSKTVPVAISHDDPFQHLSTGVFAPLWKIYRAGVEFLLDHKFFTLASVTVLFFAALVILGLSVSGVVPLIKVQFIPGSYFRYHVVVSLPPGASIERTDSVIRDLSRFIMSWGEGEVESACGTAGAYEDEDYRVEMAHNNGEVVVTLPPMGKRIFPGNNNDDLMLYLDHVRKTLDDYFTRKFPESRPFYKVFPENTGPPAGKAVNIRVLGQALEEEIRVADEIMDYLKTNPECGGLAGLEDDRPAMQSVVRFRPIPEKVSEYGLTMGAVTALVAGALHGQPAGEFQALDEKVDLMVRLARLDDDVNPLETGLDDPADILDVPVTEHGSAPVLLRDLVAMEYGEERVSLSRYNGKPAVTISSNIRAGSDLTSGRVQFLVREFFGTIRDRYPGVTLAFAGEFETTNRAYRSLTLAFFIAVFGIYLVLVAQSKDYLQPLIVVSAVTFAVIGVVFGMFVTRSTFTVGSFLAVVGLAGVAVNDSLLLVDFMNKCRKKDKALRDAVIEACSTRMRPVLITTVTTILGLLPMAIGIPHKSLEWSPMATAFVTGMASATILALLIIPVEYEAAEKLKMFFRKKE